ncbi:Ubiquitin carboxyl-terminal hydrolase 17-like protein 19 [Manis javanica]|nr:Ubiquitin carboxyl-terminal hydrolase 17-like protein 19 [Manis javanica]
MAPLSRGPGMRVHGAESVQSGDAGPAVRGAGTASGLRGALRGAWGARRTERAGGEDARRGLRLPRKPCVDGTCWERMFDKKGNEIKQGEDPVRLAGHGELHILMLRLPLGPPETHTFDPYRDIALDIKVAQSVNQALEHLVLPEKLDVLIIVKSENVYHCSICLKKAVASKTLTLHTSSKVLILVLKQFSDFTAGARLRPTRKQTSRGPAPFRGAGLRVPSSPRPAPPRAASPAGSRVLRRPSSRQPCPVAGRSAAGRTRLPPGVCPPKKTRPRDHALPASLPNPSVLPALRLQHILSPDCLDDFLPSAPANHLQEIHLSERLRERDMEDKGSPLSPCTPASVPVPPQSVPA